MPSVDREYFMQSSPNPSGGCPRPHFSDENDQVPAPEVGELAEVSQTLKNNAVPLTPGRACISTFGLPARARKHCSSSPS